MSVSDLAKAMASALDIERRSKETEIGELKFPVAPVDLNTIALFENAAIDNVLAEVARQIEERKAKERKELPRALQIAPQNLSLSAGMRTASMQEQMRNIASFR